MQWVKLNRIKISLIFIATWICFITFDDVKSETGFVDDCEIMRTGVPTVPENIIHKDAWIFNWAPENPPDYVERGGSVSLEVKGGTPKYLWQVQGQGFTLGITENTESKTNTLSAAPDTCASAMVTVTEFHGVSKQATISIGAPLAWDANNSAIEFPSGEPPVNVQITGGTGPYAWQVSAGFTLQCTNDCGVSNTLTSNGTDCIAEITVTDVCGNQTTGKVRRPGYFDTFNFCFKYKGTTCYNNPCNSSTVSERDFGDLKVEFTCCHSGGPQELTGTCGDFEYTARAGDCDVPGGCEGYGLFSLFIKRWICY